MSLGIEGWKDQKLEYAWLLKFFAEPPNNNERKDFWVDVEEMAVSMLKMNPNEKEAHAYFQKLHTGNVQKALNVDEPVNQHFCIPNSNL